MSTWFTLWKTETERRRNNDIFIYNSKDDFTSYPKAVQRAIKYLKENDFVNMEPGVYELEGKLMYAQVFDAETGL